MQLPGFFNGLHVGRFRTTFDLLIRNKFTGNGTFIYFHCYLAHLIYLLSATLII
ncbi:MAG: hypothetical protein JWR09_3171 [Mucilaginibacter sp.]|nr:hypothetical protein [Mucilaginibacter sp.]